jgi:hypothetical protein
VNGELEVRVRVMETWSDVVMRLPAPTTIGSVKQRALAAARVTADPARYLVKFRGAELSDESRSLADEHVPTDAALIVMRRRRTPVR